MLTASHIRKSFHRGWSNELLVIDDVSIEVRDGEVLVIIGPSGSGKCTFLRCLNFLELPDEGSVEFHGRTWDAASFARRHPLARLRRARELRQLRAQMGMVFQHFDLFPHMTALRNVAIGSISGMVCRARPGRAHRHPELERVGLGDKVAAYPEPALAAKSSASPSPAHSPWNHA